MVPLRIVIACAVVANVSASDASWTSYGFNFGNILYSKAMQVLDLGQTYLYESPRDAIEDSSRDAVHDDEFLSDDKQDHEDWHHHEHHGHGFHKMMQEAHACHRSCGRGASDETVACHTQCPKPWAVLSRACQAFPKIKECHAMCDDGHAITAVPSPIPCDACPKFEVEWMNRKFADHPERVGWMAETKCPTIEKIHSCHEACRPGDHSCHHQCPRMHGFHHDFHGRKHAPGCYDTVAHHCSCPPAVTESSCTAPNIWTDHCTSCATTSQESSSDAVHDDGADKQDHEGWHHHEHHGHGFHKMMQEAHACHRSCGRGASDETVACHSQCPKPWAVLSRVCQAFPKIKECHASCDDGHAITAIPQIPCNACPKFEVEWMNWKFANHPELVGWLAVTKCPTIEKIHFCHEACRPGDHSCHHQCPRMHGFHHDFHEQDHEDWHHHEHQGHEFHNMIREAEKCHWKCGADVTCHSSCPKPLPMVARSCDSLPAINACKSECEKDSTCDKCPKFEIEWLNKKYSKNPAKFNMKAQEKCPMIQQARHCHRLCGRGDCGCHSKCPSLASIFHGHHGRHLQSLKDVIV